MKRYYLIVLTVAVFVIAAGVGTTLAGGSSDTSGDGYHCYGFFALPDGTFAQFMANASKEDELVDKVVDAFMKYLGDEEGEFKFLICGNADEACVATAAEGEVPDDMQLCGGEIGAMIDYIIQYANEVSAPINLPFGLLHFKLFVNEPGDSF